MKARESKPCLHWGGGKGYGCSSSSDNCSQLKDWLMVPPHACCSTAYLKAETAFKVFFMVECAVCMIHDLLQVSEEGWLLFLKWQESKGQSKNNSVIRAVEWFRIALGGGRPSSGRGRRKRSGSFIEYCKLGWFFSLGHWIHQAKGFGFSLSV